MPDIKLVSPLLDGYVMGDPMSSHDGVSCYPAMKENDRYIVKVISTPASQRQLDALLLTGAYKDAAAATAYFKECSDGISKEAETLQQLAKLEGFLAYDNWQTVPMEDGKLGYQTYFVSPYRRSLEKFLRYDPMTHLGAVNLGLDLCAALAVCRSAGFLYVDLKPTNIYLTGEREFRIGDLGFVPLDSLKYMALPSRYRSEYSPPELLDAMGTLNPTADTYAVGMILYQIYNNGKLPHQSENGNSDLHAPLNADYEIAEIIMKAISPDPRIRWQEPTDMGQALVGYMQRNIVNDTPIVPPLAKPTAVAYTSSTDAPEISSPTTEDPEKLDSLPDETLPGAMEDDELHSAELGDELSSILAEADELIAHEAPTPQFRTDEENPDDSVENEDVENQQDEDYIQAASPSKKGGWIAALICALLLIVLCIGGFYFYKNFYLMEIEKISISGHENTMTVQLVTDADENLLRVVCTDTYGNTASERVSGGQAVFTDLNAGTTYRVTVEVDGFHALAGEPSGTYTTQEQTNISNFHAITGTEDGSVVLNFSVSGRDAQDFVVSYSAEGEDAQTLSFTGHSVTVANLTVGKTYTFSLLAPSDAELYITGETSIEFTASRIVVAEDLQIVSCVDGVLTTQWSAPADISVSSWDVRCYSNDGYDETLTVTEPSAQFQNISTESAYTVEVTAAGMAQAARAYVTANPTEITNIQLADTDDGGISVSWECATDVPSGGWLLMYSVDGSDYQEIVACSENSSTISNCVPGAVYNISIQASDGSTVFGGRTEYTAKSATSFDAYGLTASDIQASLCLTPETENWTHSNLDDSSYTTSFKADQTASMVLYATKKITYSKNNATVLYVIRSESGKIQGQFVSSESYVWSDMWSADRYVYLDIPAMPTASGSYTIEIYFDGALVTTKGFTIID